ncbi:MAG: hypothetical protein R8G66_29005 [Cytophagales bacterium]|nr:hypothetical protein [Cytophagales bacterium]
MKFWTFIWILSITTSCCEFSDKDFEFSEDQIALFGHYNIGDTIYYQSKSGDYDTLTVSRIDSSQQCGGFMGFPVRGQSVEIKHVPKNKWVAGISHYEDKPAEEIDQSLITIVKTPIPDKNMYNVGFDFRDFYAGVDGHPNKQNDDFFTDLQIKEYWQVKTELPLEHQTDSSVVEIFWTSKFGLTAYFLKNGDYYKIKNGR